MASESELSQTGKRKATCPVPDEDELVNAIPELLEHECFILAQIQLGIMNHLREPISRHCNKPSRIRSQTPARHRPPSNSVQRNQMLQAARRLLSPPPFNLEFPAALVAADRLQPFIPISIPSASVDSDSAKAVALSPRARTPRGTMASLRDLEMFSMDNSVTSRTAPGDHPSPTSHDVDLLRAVSNLSCVLQKPDRVSFKEHPVLELQHPRDVLVRTNYTGICASDVRYYVHGTQEDFLVYQLATAIEARGNRTPTTHCGGDIANNPTSLDVSQEAKPRSPCVEVILPCEPKIFMGHEVRGRAPVPPFDSDYGKGKENFDLLVEAIPNEAMSDVLNAMDVFLLVGRIVLGRLFDCRHRAQDPDPGRLKHAMALQ